MKANNDKQLEKMVDKLMKETSLESPSPEFTAKLMIQVQATEMDKAVVYKPLISKGAWFIIFAGIIAVTGYLIFNADVQKSSWFQQFDFSFKMDTVLNGFTAFKFSTITSYAIVMLTVMLMAQVGFLARYYNKRVDV